MEYEEVMKKLKMLSSPENVEGMARFGINPDKTLGVSIPNLRAIAKKAGKDHALAQKLWDSGIHEARILAGMVDDPEKVTERQMDEWASGFDSWDVCDQACMNLFRDTKFAYRKAYEWSKNEKEFVKRAAFALVAVLAWQDRGAPDAKMEKFLPMIMRASNDERNFVRKAVNWALRQIGKRNRNLNKAAIKCAKEIAGIDSRAARWIAADALRELEGTKVQERLMGK